MMFTFNDFLNEKTDLTNSPAFLKMKTMLNKIGVKLVNFYLNKRKRLYVLETENDVEKPSFSIIDNKVFVQLPQSMMSPQNLNDFASQLKKIQKTAVEIEQYFATMDKSDIAQA